MCKPGRRAKEPFLDWTAKIRELEPAQQNAVMGKALFRLWTKGVVPIDEIVTASRVRSLQEVISRNRLSIKTLIRAGVRPDIAKAAYSAVHTPEHELAEAHRRKLLEQIQSAGVHHDLAVKHIGAALASRVNIAAGPSYTTKSGIVLPGIQAQQLINPAEQRQRQADELATLLGGAAGMATVTAAMRRRKKKRDEDESGDEPWKPLRPAE